MKKNIIPKWKNNKLNLFSNNINIENDYVVWSGNPTNLIYEYNNKKLDSLYLKTIQINANVLSEIPENIYLQIFSEKTDISRIYFYKLNNQNKISIECIYNKNDTSKILKEAEKILLKFNYKLKIDKSKIYKKLDVRFNIVSVNDTQILLKFLENTKDTNLINSPWLHYGRDKKISFLLNEFKKRKII